MNAPVLGVPALSQPDLLQRLIRSIDHPVRLLVIDNSPDGEMFDPVAEVAEGHPHLVSWFVSDPPANLGVSASWNLIIRTAPLDPYWLIANLDTEFGPGDIAKVCAEMEKGGPRWVGVNGDWRLMGMTFELVEAAGFFDENLHPIYFEDCDYERRCSLLGIPWYFVEGGSTHYGSASIKRDASLNRRNNRTFPANRAYYEAKWGGTARGGETFATPFDRGGHVGDWRLDVRRLRDNDWSR